MIELIKVCEGYNKHYQFIMASHKTTAHLLWESINVVFILFKLAISRSEHKWAKFTCKLNFSA